MHALENAITGLVMQSEKFETQNRIMRAALELILENEFRPDKLVLTARTALERVGDLDKE